MANVLPIPAQKDVWRTYRARYVIAGSVLLLMLSLVGAISLLPSYLALEIAAPSTTMAVLRKSDGAVDPLAISRAQALVDHVTPFLQATTTPTALIAETLRSTPSGVTIDRISVTESSTKITIAGTATREQLNSYRNALIASGSFKEVSVPVGALVGTEGGRFSMTLTSL